MFISIGNFEFLCAKLLGAEARAEL